MAECHFSFTPTGSLPGLPSRGPNVCFSMLCDDIVLAIEELLKYHARMLFSSMASFFS
jgi:predicted ester cyclase